MELPSGAKSIELLKDTTLLDIQKNLYKLQKLYQAYIDDMPVYDMKQTLNTIAHLHQKVKFSSGYNIGLQDSASTLSKTEDGRKKYGRDLQNTRCMKTGSQWSFIHVMLPIEFRKFYILKIIPKR